MCDAGLVHPLLGGEGQNGPDRRVPSGQALPPRRRRAGAEQSGRLLPVQGHGGRWKSLPCVAGDGGAGGPSPPVFRTSAEAIIQMKVLRLRCFSRELRESKLSFLSPTFLVIATAACFSKTF